MRLRLNRTTLLLALVVLLLATVPILVPLVGTQASGTPGARPATPSGVPALPAPDSTPSTGAPAAPPAARSLAPTTASPTPDPTTASPTAPPPTTTAVPAPPPGPAAPPAPDPAPGSTPPAPTEQPTVRSAGPDLVVLSVSWSPAEGELTAGQPVTFSAVVRNTGTDPTPERTHGVAFSVDGTKVTWSSESSAPLAPGEERVYTADGGPDGPTWTAVPGEHTVEAEVDDESRIPETNRDNNTATTTLTLE